MSPEAWKFVLSKESYTTININEMSAAKEMLNVCFGKDSAPRKELLIDHDGDGVQVSVSSGLEKMSLKKKAPKKVAKKAVKKIAKKVVKKKTAKKKTSKKSKKR